MTTLPSSPLVVGSSKNDRPSPAHVGSVGIEETNEARVHAAEPGEVRAKSFRRPLAFVVAGAGTGRVHVAEIGLRLRMDEWVAVDLGSRGVQHACLMTFGVFEGVQGPVHGDT